MAAPLSENTGLTLKEKKFVKNLIACGKVGESALRAGYSDRSYGSFLLRQDKVLTAIQVEMEKQGVDDKFLVKKLKQGLGATYPAKLSKDGKVLQAKSPDYFTRERYLEQAFKLRGDYAPEKHEVEHKQIVIVITPELAKGLIDSEVIDVEEVQELQEQAEHKNTQKDGKADETV